MNARGTKPAETARDETGDDPNAVFDISSARPSSANTGDGKPGNSDSSDAGRRERGDDMGGIPQVVQPTGGNVGESRQDVRANVPGNSSTKPAGQGKINFAARVGETKKQNTTVLVGSEARAETARPRSVEFEMPEGKRPVGRPKGSSAVGSSGSMKADDFAFLISAMFGLYSMTRPIYLREAWEFPPQECQVVAEKLIVCIKQLPGKYAETIDRFAAPAGLVVSAGMMIVAATQREKAIHEHFTKMVQQGNATAEQLRSVGYPLAGGVKPSQTVHPKQPIRNNSGNGAREPKPDSTGSSEFPAEFYSPAIEPDV